RAVSSSRSAWSTSRPTPRPRHRKGPGLAARPHERGGRVLLGEGPGRGHDEHRLGHDHHLQRQPAHPACKSPKALLAPPTWSRGVHYRVEEVRQVDLQPPVKVVHTNEKRLPQVMYSGPHH